MDYSKIVFTLELYGDSANSSANALLKKGWLLISVGSKLIDIVDGQAYYNTAYVVGATKEQYDKYLTDIEDDFDNFIVS